MRTLLPVIFLVLTTFPAPCQTASSKYQRGTVVAVAPHSNSPGKTDAARYEVSVQVGETVYVTLYTPPNGANSIEYAAGIDFLVLVGKDTLTFPSKLTGTTEVPILRREAAQARSPVDWSKAHGQYFTIKMQNLTERLDLTDEQQAKIKPIAEQESGDAGQIIFTTPVPAKERLNRWERIVHMSDAKMKPILSPAQWEKLQKVRKEQKHELKKLIAEKNESKQK